jgi:predicted 3-demethylubiquinone-9 3-methyltransferase (glyoxalase superfamily)
VSIARYGESGAMSPGRAKGSVMTVAFVLEGQPFVALNGGPEFTFSPAISFVVNCKTQKEIDDLWKKKKLSHGGEEVECGWLKDKYGVSWQIVPAVLGEMVSDSDPQKSESVMQALLRMKNLDIEGLKRAYDQPSGDTGAHRKKLA